MASAAQAQDTRAAKRPGEMGAEWVEKGQQRQSRVTLSMIDPREPDPSLYRTVEYDWEHSTLESGRYPPAAFAAGDEGSVHVRFAVDADGRPSNCAVAGSSGVAALDAHACPHLIANVRFFPALDTQGARVGSVAAATLSYELGLYMITGADGAPSSPGGKPPAPRKPIRLAELGLTRETPHGKAYGATATMMIGADGVPVACNVTNPTQDDAFDFRLCDALMKLAFAPGTDGAGVPVAMRYVASFDFKYAW